LSSQFGKKIKFISLGVKRSGRGADHSPPSSAEVKRMRGAIPPFPNTPSWRGVQLPGPEMYTHAGIHCCAVAHPLPNITHTITRKMLFRSKCNEY